MSLWRARERIHNCEYEQEYVHGMYVPTPTLEQLFDEWLTLGEPPHETQLNPTTPRCASLLFVNMQQRYHYRFDSN